LSIEKALNAKKIPDETAPARKFMFECSFDDATVVHRAPERKAILMKPDQLDSLKNEAYSEGFAAGKKAGKEEQIAQQTSVLSRIDQNVGELIKNIAAIAQEQEGHTRRLALTIAKKILPAFTLQNGLQEIETLVNETLRDMVREPRIVARVHEAEFGVLNEKIQALATQRAFAGKVVIIADPNVASGDCRIEWTDGGVERNMSATANAIEQTLLPSS
jgi:flagellar assembly protein FliH